MENDKLRDNRRAPVLAWYGFPNLLEILGINRANLDHCRIRKDYSCLGLEECGDHLEVEQLTEYRLCISKDATNWEPTNNAGGGIRMLSAMAAAANGAALPPA